MKFTSLKAGTRSPNISTPSPPTCAWRWSASLEERDDALVVFTAHSLPAFILERGEPYDRQLRETASLLAQKLNLPAERWSFSYQSAANTGVPWLGPQIEEFIVELAQRGEKNVIVAPIGFIADHVEVLYDIDIGVQAIACEHGVRAERRRCSTTARRW